MEGWVDLGYPAMHRPGVELAIFRSPVRRPTTTLPRQPYRGSRSNQMAVSTVKLARTVRSSHGARSFAVWAKYLSESFSTSLTVHWWSAVCDNLLILEIKQHMKMRLTVSVCSCVWVRYKFIVELDFISYSVKPNTHRRRNATVELSRVSGVNTICN